MNNAIDYPQPHKLQQHYNFDGAADAIEDFDTTTAEVDSFPTTPMISGPMMPHPDETNALILLLLSFFIGMASITLWVVIFVKYRNSPSERARMYAKIAAIFTSGVILFFVYVFLLAVHSFSLES